MKTHQKGKTKQSKAKQNKTIVYQLIQRYQLTSVQSIKAIYLVTCILNNDNDDDYGKKTSEMYTVPLLIKNL
jgi:hypothetical protein